MKGISSLVVLLPLILAAAPVHPGPLPVPPIPPAYPPADGAAPSQDQAAAAPGALALVGPAPIPDENAAAPIALESDHPKITPHFIRAPSFHNSYDPSQGYITGSRWQDDPAEDRRPTPSPGINVVIPFKY